MDNIENNETCHLVRERRQRDLNRRVDELLAIGQRCAASLDPGPSASEHGDLLYDDRGLPGSSSRGPDFAKTDVDKA